MSGCQRLASRGRTRALGISRPHPKQPAAIFIDFPVNEAQTHPGPTAHTPAPTTENFAILGIFGVPLASTRCWPNAAPKERFDGVGGKGAIKPGALLL